MPTPSDPALKLSHASDGDLLRSFAAGRHEAAFAEIVRRYLPLAMGAALRRVKSRPLAEEAVQDAFVILAKKVASVPPDRLAAWLHRTAFLEACAVARREDRFARPLPDPALLQSSAMPPVESYPQLDAALRGLPELDRELLLRRYTLGEKVREIASGLGKSEEACQKRIERSLVRLRSQLTKWATPGSGTAAALVLALQGLASRPAGAATVQKITAGALQQAATSSGGLLGGTLPGTIAACVAAAALATTMAWPRQAEPPPSSLAAEAAPKSNDHGRRNIALTAQTDLKPRPEIISRSLADVLDSIHTGRLGPLVEFLPGATVADLQAILREDDLAALGERSMERTTAHWLALRHWAAIEPATAWEYAGSRDNESLGHVRLVSSLVFSLWAKSDPGAAWPALASLSVAHRAQVANSIALLDPSLAEEILTRYPEHFWQMASYIDQHTSGKESRIVDAVVRGGSTGLRSGEIAAAFTSRLTEGDESILAKAREIQDQTTRHAVLTWLARRFPDKFSPAAVPAGKARQDLVKAQYTMRLSRENLPLPDDPILQAAWLEARGSGLSFDDPISLLTNLASARLDGIRLDVHEQGTITVGPSWLEAALRNAALQDPQQTVRLLPAILRNVPEAYVPWLLREVVQSWVKKDPAEAIRWSLQRDIEGLERPLREAMWQLRDGGDALLAMLPTASEQELFFVLTGLSSCYQELLTGPDPWEILQQVTPEQADALLRKTLIGSTGNGAWDEAIRLAGYASPTERLGYLLPNLATRWLNQQPAEATEWINRLSPEERQAVLRNAGSHYQFTAEGRSAFERLQP